MTGEPRSAQRIVTLCLATLLGLVFPASARAQESWDAIFLGGSKIGYVHTYLEKVKNQGRDYHRVRFDIEQRIKRGERDVSVTRLTYGTIETPDGQVLRLDTLIDAAQQQRIRTHGDVILGEMKLIMEVGAPSKKLSCRGVPRFAAPMRPSKASLASR